MFNLVNLYAGPGTGKSTTAADLFAKMKWAKYNVELVTEYAKDITWEGRYNLLQDDQLYILAKQNRRLQRLKGQVDWVITDCPLLLGHVYASDDYLPNFKGIVMDLYNSYNNINIFLERQKDYVRVGRTQTEEEARQVDVKVRSVLDNVNVPYSVIPANVDAKDAIFNLIT